MFWNHLMYKKSVFGFPICSIYFSSIFAFQSTGKIEKNICLNNWFCPLASTLDNCWNRSDDIFFCSSNSNNNYNCVDENNTAIVDSLLSLYERHQEKCFPKIVARILAQQNHNLNTMNFKLISIYIHCPAQIWDHQPCFIQNAVFYIMWITLLTNIFINVPLERFQPKKIGTLIVYHFKNIPPNFKEKIEKIAYFVWKLKYV